MRKLKQILLDRQLPAWSLVWGLLGVALFAAALAAADWALTPWLRRGAALLLALLGLLLTVLILRRLAGDGDTLLRASRALADQRGDVRAADLPGLAGEIGAQINRIGQQLGSLRDQFEQRVGDATLRLRRERDQLSAQLQQLRASAGQAQDDARAQSELLSSLSHELRTPLTAILGYSDLLRRSGLNADQAQQLDTLDKSARTLLTMITDLLDWSRIEAGRLRLNEERFDLFDVAEDTCALLAPLAYDKQLELVRIVYHDVPRQLRGDPQRLRQILTNLLSNAIKFTEHGEVVLRVMQERESGGRTWLRFSITDSGIGISPEQQSRLFQPYRQVGSGEGGSGLGLSITRKLSELMGGEVALESTLGRGSTFSALLPFKLAADAEGGRPHDARLAEHKVWVHEPHAMAQLALVHWLEFWGLQVRVFASAPELLESLRHAAATALPDAVILGLKPELIGNPTISALLATCRQQRPPLLALVASAALPVQQALRAAGAAACQPKSLSRQRLHDELAQLLALHEHDGSEPLAGRRAVVADNNLINRRWLSTLCTGLGLDVVEAGNGREAFEAWLRHRPDIVLLDARMPELDGPGAARAIRKAENGLNPCHIVAVSAYLEPEERHQFLAAGANDVLLKPFDETQLLRTLAPVPVAAGRVTAKLAADPELLALLRDELPLQLAELEQAMAALDLPAARDAAHTLRGTAAFYHLASLRQTTAALEDWLKRATRLQQTPAARRELESVRRAVADTLAAIQRS